MSFRNINTELFYEVARLPLGIIGIIVDYLSKCMLPELLYFLPIRRVVASAILSDVNITEAQQRHKKDIARGLGYSRCKCTSISIKPKSLKRGSKRWNILPEVIHLGDIFAFELTYKTFPEVLYMVPKIDAYFYGYDTFDPKIDANYLKNSGVNFDSLFLYEFMHVKELPTVITSLKLIGTTLDSYVIDGLKKLSLELSGDENTTKEYSFPSSLEDLTIKGYKLTRITLPPNLRRLYISTFLKSVDFVSEEMPHLEYLLLSLPDVKNLEDTGICAPNLKTQEIHNRSR